MARFSERNGFVAPRSVMQVDDLDKPTRSHVWNVVYTYHFQPPTMTTVPRSITKKLLIQLWVFLNRPLQELEYKPDFECRNLIESIIKNDKFHEVADLLECFVGMEIPGFKESLNKSFEHFMVGYRVIGTEICPVTSDVEITAIEEALVATNQFSGAQTHLKTALSLVSDRSTPKYAKVMHEAISAVEAVARHYTGERTLGAALKKLEPKGIPAHKALTTAWSQLYGYTSDENGIRHGSVVDADVDEAMATYFLVTCSAFVGYLIKKAGA